MVPGKLVHSNDMFPKVTLRFYVTILCSGYFGILYIFYGHLQQEIQSDKADTAWAKWKNAAYKIMDKSSYNSTRTENKIDDLTQVIRGPSAHRRSMVKDDVVITAPHQSSDGTCYLPSNSIKRTFQFMEKGGIYIYSAYLDERLPEKRFIRIMTLMMSAQKSKKTVSFFCHFKESLEKQNASIYELCENHGEEYGGYMVSCAVPKHVTDVCQITVSAELLSVDPSVKLESTIAITLDVTKINTKHVQYNYGVCVPPLFGKLRKEQLIEFIEMHKLLGVSHFIFYNFSIKDAISKKVLDYYSERKEVTVIPWFLPSVMQGDKIWYHGQLSVHNDCMYRAMSMMKHLAIIDIDEFIVPHKENGTWTNSFDSFFKANMNTCALSFDSAFYEPVLSYESASNLITMGSLRRSQQFSHVRTKVIVQPAKVFETGIHHVSKPLNEGMKVIKVNTSEAYMHHYRTCVPNYGMQCGKTISDKTMLQYFKNLKDSVYNVLKEIVTTDYVEL
ncbi:hypothetical protein CHS0354_037430 [Potamilus streckersoni]|uniref:Glycosyltransferase family 92 protein n=1 Tax=Potamilus streckersoni TaxID=2493646 RepID=A0AAE0RS07_9BIVA|nr:hypothetical protein CHS0354_037430 [Potamilus streckersoni]